MWSHPPSEKKEIPFWWCCERKYRWFNADKIMKGGTNGRASSTGIWQCGTSACTWLSWQPRWSGGSIAFLLFSATKWHHRTLSSKVARSICNFFWLCQGKGFLILNVSCFVVTPCHFPPVPKFSLELRTLSVVFFAVCFCDKTVPSYDSFLSSV